MAFQNSTAATLVADRTLFGGDAFARTCRDEGFDSPRRLTVVAATRAAEVEAAYEQAAEVDARRTALEVEFDRVRGDEDAELVVLQAAKRFDEAHPSRDPLYAQLHADQMFGRAA